MSNEKAGIARESISPLRAALIGLVTLVALLLFARTHVRSIEWRYEYPAMSLEDPVRALFSFAEYERRKIQSGLLPRWEIPKAPCTACDEASLDVAFRDLLDEHRRYRDSGHRHFGARFEREAEAARQIALAGWGNPTRVAALRSLDSGQLPSYLSDRRDELLRDDSQPERARVEGVGRIARATLVIRYAFSVLAIALLFAWRGRFRYPRRPARSRLPALSLGHGLVVYIWAEGFVAVLTRLRWDNPDGPFEMFATLPSLSLALAICLLVHGTRQSATATPVKYFLRFPPDHRSRRAIVLAALASVGIVYMFNWGHFQLLHSLGYAGTWTDSIREPELYGSLSVALVRRLSGATLTPFAEELTYRGVLFGSLARRMSSHRAALLSSMIFAATHGYDWFGFASVALSGYLWARLAARTGSIVPGMIAHGVFNLVWGLSVFAWRV
ncbi:MAG TPA: CPBP family intramembrane glutamic endopeptidase [Polyangiaceae bacterium]|nr:CPBP family intramembrane glutamic endopeptidase [Polyangiaceae bacterium]